MKPVRTLRILISAIGLFGISYSCVTHSNSSSKKVTLASGDYLRDDYLAILDKSKSPLQALKQGSFQLINVKADSTGFAFSAIENFHDGIPIFYLHKNGTVDSSISIGKKAANVKIKILDSRHLTLGFNTFVPENYTFVGSVERFVASKTLAGKFADLKGTIYEFKDNGTATIGAETIKYTIGLDYPPSFTMDYYTSNSVDYGFRHYNDTLKIYKVNGESLFEGGTVQNDPWLVLLKTQ